jgi:hypothetical protein
MRITKRQLKQIIKEEKTRLKEQGVPVQQGTKEAARGARGAFNQLISLLTQAQLKAAEMANLNRTPGGSNDFTWEGNESLDVVDLLEKIYEAAGFADDGSTLKEFL